jgi:hypothetical protein
MGRLFVVLGISIALVLFFPSQLCHSWNLTSPLLELLRLDDFSGWAKVASRGD